MAGLTTATELTKGQRFYHPDGVRTVLTTARTDGRIHIYSTDGRCHTAEPDALMRLCEEVTEPIQTAADQAAEMDEARL